MYSAGIALFSALIAVTACAGESAQVADKADAGTPDSGPPEGASAALSPDRYDCNASGPFIAPTKPYPRDCHRNPDCTSKLTAGHRFATLFAPENTLSALRAAILLGADLVETDIRVSQDGEVVLMHDGSIDRTTSGTGDVSDFTLAELRELAIRTAPSDTGDYSCERVPTLDELFTLSRGQTVVVLEIKASAAGVKAAQYLRDNDLYAHALLLCDPNECAAARAAVPDVPIMSRPRSAVELPAEIAYDPPPTIVHIDPDMAFLNPDVITAIHGVGAKVYANGFIADPVALLSKDVSGYIDIYDRGADVQQVEAIHLLLFALGRLPAQ